MNLSLKPISIFLGIAILIMLVGYFVYKTPSPPPPSNTIYTPIITLPLDRWEEEELTSLSTFKKKETKQNGETNYLYETPNQARESSIITNKDGKIIFKKVITTDTDYSHPKISEYVKINGEPEEVYTGSKKYGPYATYTLYPSKGIVIIGNPLTDEVFELDLFSEMSLDEYMRKYGSDVDTSGKQVNQEDPTPVSE